MKSIVHHGKLHHGTPDWVPSGARFHIRIRIKGPQRILTDTAVGRALLKAAGFYHARERWYTWLFLLTPDHLHSICTFPPETSMSRTIADWKRYQKNTLGIVWQENYFDHRLRNDEEFIEKCSYIRMNPVRAELCKQPEDWPWVAEPWRNLS
jgi:REP element-mobilizing transposase RayT